jgi:hypothetical protein
VRVWRQGETQAEDQPEEAQAEGEVMPTAWPESLPVEDALAVLKAAARGKIDEVKPLTANCGWVALGFLGGQTFPLPGGAPPLRLIAEGDGGPVPDILAEPSQLSIEEGIGLLESLEHPEATQAAIGPVVFVQLAWLLYRVAKRYRLLP